MWVVQDRGRGEGRLQAKACKQCSQCRWRVEGHCLQQWMVCSQAHRQGKQVEPEWFMPVERLVQLGQRLPTVSPRR